MTPPKKIFLLIAIATTARVIIASTIGLGNDEVYYWTYAQHLQWSYFDHPPIVGWIVRLTTANLLLNQELFVRLGAIISSAAGTWLIYRVGTELKDPQAGWYAALLYTASLYSSIIAGTFILPDSPQVVLWLTALLYLLRISGNAAGSKNSIKLWCYFGVAAGLCMMSKVHGVFLWVAAALYVMFIDSKVLRHPGIYLSALTSAIIVSPVVAWNIQHDFISYRFHSERVSVAEAGFEVQNVIRELAGEIFYNNPINFFLIATSLIAICRGRYHGNSRVTKVVLFCSLPLIVVVWAISLFRETLPHWSGLAYTCLLLLPAIQLSSRRPTYRMPRVLKGALAFIAVLTAAGIIIINYWPGTLSPEKAGLKTGEGDFTLDMYGWNVAGQKVDSVYTSDLVQGFMPPGVPMIVTKWFPGAHVNFYIARRSGLNVYGIGTLFDLHHFVWLNGYSRALQRGDAAYYIVPSNLFSEETLTEVSRNFKEVSPPVVIPVLRSGVLCKNLYLYRLKGFHL